jgi:hypothetical protein
MFLIFRLTCMWILPRVLYSSRNDLQQNKSCRRKKQESTTRTNKHGLKRPMDLLVDDLLVDDLSTDDSSTDDSSTDDLSTEESSTEESSTEESSTDEQHSSDIVKRKWLM